MARVYRTDPEPFAELADLLKALAHPQRICIIKTLCEKERSNVTDMQDCLGEAQSTVSQHLAKLRAARLIAGERDGTNVYYSIPNEETKVFLSRILAQYFPESISLSDPQSKEEPK